MNCENLIQVFYPVFIILLILAQIGATFFISLLTSNAFPKDEGCQVLIMHSFLMILGLYFTICGLHLADTILLFFGGTTMTANILALYYQIIYNYY